MAGGGDHEINLVPYLDIVVTLTIAFLVLTLEIDALSSAKVDPAPQGGPATGADTNLAVLIRPEGFVVRQDAAEVTIAREGETWPYARLTEALRALRDGGEATEHLRVAPEPRIPYSIVVATLDAARSDARGVLYPDVALAIAAP